MENLQSILEKLESVNAHLTKQNVRSVLILFHEKMIYLGDTVIRTSRIRLLNSFFTNATIDANIVDPSNANYVDGLLKNNPYIRAITMKSWDDIDFAGYDLVIGSMYDEEAFLRYMYHRYNGFSNMTRPAIFSLSRWLLLPGDEKKARYVLPVHEELREHFTDMSTGELYISPEEQAWADKWLEDKGLRPNEKLFVIVDNSKSKSKMMRINVFYELLTFLLTRWNCKVLIFDENNIGKEDFYRELLSSKCFGQMIFSKKNTLREDLCLIGSSYTRLVLGPCTGLMHCASSIFNAYEAAGLEPEKVPVIITYTGRYELEEYCANAWWQNCPLVDCLILKEKGNRKELLVLNDIEESQRDIFDQLPTNQYEAKMLIDFVSSRLLKCDQPYLSFTI